LQQELSNVAQQRLQMDLKLRETVHTLDELKTVPVDATIYRPLGGLLVKAKNPKEIEDMLTEEKETLEIRVKSIERQENALKERYSTMQRQLSEQLQAAGLASGEPTQ
ncbi:MAG: prefoldin subunit beta, partial [Thermoplasmata archaeon]|nr:prefoldin subunit beta [Thermoplasmata archaeon]